MNCTAAPLLERDVEDSGSAYAEEGTLAHAYCAKKLKEFLGLPFEEECREIERLDGQYHTGEMDEATDTYMAIVLEKYNAARTQTRDAQLLVEVRLDFGKYVPDSFGTSDAIIIADGTMEVIDFKYGKGVKVTAEKNPQMMIYALGAWDAFDFEYRIQKVRMTIVQPRIDNLSEYEVCAAEIVRWAMTDLRPKALEAYEGGRQKPGDWCRFCKVKNSCTALASACLDTVRNNPEPKLVGKEDMEIRILPMLTTVKTWLSGIEDYALQQALAGVRYRGFKLVEGRSVRRIADQQSVIGILGGEGLAEDSYIKPAELRSITELEKLLGKKRFGALCGDYIVKPAGKPTLVPESDKRPEFCPENDDFKDILLTPP